MSQSYLQPLLQQKPSQPPNNKRNSIFSIFKYADKQDKLLMGVGSLAAVGAGIASPLFMIFFSTISQIFIPGNQENAEKQGKELFFQLMAIGIYTWACHTTAMWAWNKSGARQTHRLKKLYYEALLKQDMKWFDHHQTGKITSEISQNSLAIEAVIGEKLSFLITVLVTSLFGLIYALIKCWQMSLYLTIFMPFMLLAGYLMMKSLSIKAKASKISYQNASSIAETVFGSIRTVKILVSEKFWLKKFKSALSKAQPNLKSQIVYSCLASAFFTLIMMGIYSFGFFIGKQMMIGSPEKYKSSEIIATFFCFMVASQNIGQISPMMKTLADAKVAAKKIYDLMDSEISSLQNQQQGRKVELVQSIQMKNINFSYTKSKQSVEDTKSLTLKDVSLIFKKGSITALVGSSGSGKSTIAQLIMNYYRPEAGKVLINAQNLSQFNSFEYRKKIGYVGQQPVLFSMSIKENIQLANPQITDQQIKQVLKKSQALQFVEELQKGMQTYVGNKGTQLSGGQKQRIAIARTLAKNPNAIIFDESTSALDQQSQSKVQKTISNLAFEGKIVIVIAHRLSTIRCADTIVVLDKGEVVQQGNHEELLKRRKRYYDLIKTQLEQKEEEKKNEEVVKKELEQKEEEKEEKQKIVGIKDEGFQVKKTRNRFQIYKQLVKYSKQKKTYILLGSIFALLNGAANPLFNITFSNVIGLLQNAETNNSEINYYCFAFLIVSIISAFSHFGHFFLFGVYGQALVFQLRVAVFRKILKFPTSFFDKQQNAPGAISVKLSQNSYQLHNALTGILSVLFLNFSIIILSVIFAFYFCWKLAFIVIIFSPLLAAKGAIAMTFLSRISKDSDQIQKTTGAFISDTIGNIRTVKSFGGYTQFLNIFQQKLDKLSSITSKKFLKMGILQGFSRSSAVIIYAIVFWTAAALFTGGQLQNPRDALIAIFCIIFSATTVGQNSQLMPDLNKAQKSANELLDILESQDEQQTSRLSEDESLANCKIKGRIEFKNVNFRYPSRKEIILSNFSLKIEEKQIVCLVGASGSGKSTIFHLLSRLYSIQSGQILIDDKPIQSYNLYKFRRQMGVLTQQPIIFQGSIRQNVLSQYQKRNKYNLRFETVSKMCLVNKISESQNGYDKQVGEKGSLVSGGEKQRIAMARCLIKSHRILLMDQPTSALDVETEQKVFENIFKQLNRKTVVYSAHRLCTVKHAKRVIIMKKGKIIESGQFKQLMKKEGELYRLMKTHTETNKIAQFSN